MGQLETVYAVRKLLLDNANVAAQVVARIYPLENVPQKMRQFPYIAIGLGGASHTHHLLGASGFAMYNIDVFLFCDTVESMNSLAVLVRKALDGQTGTVTVGSDSVVLEQCFLTNETNQSEAPDAGGSTPYFIRLMEFDVGNKIQTS